MTLDHEKLHPETLAISPTQAAPDRSAPARVTPRDVVFHEACELIRFHYRDPQLGPDEIARRMRCSRATLYRAFQSRGLTVSGYILCVRLEHVRANLHGHRN